MKTRIKVLFLIIGFALLSIAVLPTFLFANQLPVSSVAKLSPQITPTPMVDLHIFEPPQLISPLPIEPNQPVTFTVVVHNIGYPDIYEPFFIDIFLDPQELYSDHIPITQSSGYAALPSLTWDYGGYGTIVTITAQSGFTYTPTTHLVYATVDSMSMVSESSETNNISPPLMVTDTLPFLYVTPPCAAGSDMTMSVYGVRWPTDENVHMFWQGGLETTMTSPHSGSFSYEWTKTGLTSDTYAIMATSDSYTKTANFTIPCPASNVPIQSAAINGETNGATGIDQLFRIDIAPINTTLPITYRWQATGQTTITQTGGGLETAVFNWPDEGIKMITVTADNGLNIVTDTHQINLLRLADLLTINPPKLITPLPIDMYHPVSFTVAITNSGETDIDSLFYIGISLDPQEVFTDRVGISRSTFVRELAANESRVITVTVPNGFTSILTTHLVYAMVDATRVIYETNETNNISSPLTVSDPIELMISGVETAVPGQTITLTANITPTTAAQPITYRWEAAEHETITQTGGLTETAVFNWSNEGTKTITVTANNGLNIVTDTHKIDISGVTDLLIITPPQLNTSLPIEPYQPVSFTVIITNSGESDIDNLFFIDIFLNPQYVFTDRIPISQSSGYTSISSLAAGHSRVVTITSQLGFTSILTTNQVYAMADSLEVIETNETNNISPPLTVFYSWRAYLPVIWKE